MNKLMIASIVLLVAGVVVISMSLNSDSPITGNVVNEGNEGAKTFVMTGENFKFVMDGKDNPDIVIKQGDKVRIEFKSTQGFHDWVVDEFSAATKQVRDTDGSTFVEFTAEKAGTFEYYCSVGKHREMGMKGNLIVK